MGRIYRRGRVLWIQYSHRGETFRESTKSDLRREAAALLKRRMAEIGRGIARPGEADRLTFDELAGMLEDDYSLNERKSVGRARLSIRHLRSYFGRFVASEMTPDRVASYIRWRMEDPERPVKASTVRCEVAALKRMFTLAVQNGRLPYRPSFPRIEVDNIRTGFFEEDQLQAVIRELPEHLRPIALYAWRTGWRRGEIVSLRWAAVDMAAGVVRLEPGRTKNGEGRSFPFVADPVLQSLIRSQREWVHRIERATGQVIPWVFPKTNGHPVADFYGAWRAACRRAGVPGRLFHDFRRTAVRNLERAGVSRSVAMKLTGHKTEAVYRRYAIVSEADLAEGVAKLALVSGRRSADGFQRVWDGATSTVLAQSADLEASDLEAASSNPLETLVPGAGVEPARAEAQRILSPLRLPFRHPGMIHCTGKRNGARCL